MPAQAKEMQKRMLLQGGTGQEGQGSGARAPVESPTK
jgi:hypothetical protein